MSEWIKVVDRLPNSSNVVLFCIIGREVCEMGWLQIEGDKWQSVETAPQDEPIYFDLEQVTHWMPLPEPPK
jgi:hypothetical protein